MELPQYFASNGQPEFMEAPAPAVVMPGYMEAPPYMVNMPQHGAAPPPMVVMPKNIQAPDPMMTTPHYVETSPPLVVTTQPSTIVLPPPTVYKDYLAWSILNLICCCLLLGAVALRYSIKTLVDKHRQDQVTASRHSDSAFGWNVLATVVGTCIQIGWVSYIIYYYVAFR